MVVPIMKPLDAEQPLVTLAVIAYAQEDIILEAIEAAFRQTYHPLEILLSDDCSPDNTFEVMKQAAAEYRGPHTIRLNRNEKNLGAIGHVNRIFELSCGELIVVNAGDDRSRPNRVSRIVEEFLQNDRPLMLHSAVEKIDLDGRSLGEIWDQGPILENMRLRKASLATALCIGASSAWNRKLFEIFGPIEERHAYGDLVFSFRAILMNSLVGIDEPLVEYRLGGYSTRKPANRVERIKKRNSRRRTQIAVLRQRLADLRRVQPQRGRLIALLEQTIEKLKETTPPEYWP